MSQLEVSRLESRLKYESLILGILWGVVVERWEREWLSISLVLVVARNTNAILRLEEFLKVAGPYQLVEIVCIKLFGRVIVALSESGVYNWVLLALGEFTLVLEIEKMAQGGLCVLSRLDHLLDFLLLVVSVGLSRY